MNKWNLKNNTKAQKTDSKNEICVKKEMIVVKMNFENMIKMQLACSNLKLK